MGTHKKTWMLVFFVAGPRKKPSSMIANVAVMLPVSTERRMSLLMTRSSLRSAGEFFFADVSCSARGAISVRKWRRRLSKVRTHDDDHGHRDELSARAGGGQAVSARRAGWRAGSERATHDVGAGAAAEPDGGLGEEGEQLRNRSQVCDLRGGSGQRDRALGSTSEL